MGAERSECQKLFRIWSAVFGPGGGNKSFVCSSQDVLAGSTDVLIAKLETGI